MCPWEKRIKPRTSGATEQKHLHHVSWRDKRFSCSLSGQLAFLVMQAAREDETKTTKIKRAASRSCVCVCVSLWETWQTQPMHAEDGGVD